MAINKNVLAEKQATVLSEDGNTMYATIQMRHGKESEMDKSKFVPAEMGVATDTKKAFMAFGSNQVKEMMFREDSEIEELLEEVRDISDQAVEAVESAEATAKQAIEDYTEQMKATIPEDYTEMVKKVDVLERTKAPAIMQTVSGESLQIEDSADAPMAGLRVFGKSRQVKTTGAQLIPCPIDEELESYDGFVAAISKDNGIEVTLKTGFDPIKSNSDIYFAGGNQANEESNYELQPQIPAGEYHLHIDDKTFNSFSFYIIVWRNGTSNTLSAGTTQDRNITIQENDKFRIFIRPKASATTGTYTIKPMLNSGSTALPWEPYTGGKPSPSPDYPQEIEIPGSEGSVGVNVTGAQLAPINKAKSNEGVTVSFNSDGSLNITGTPNKQYARVLYEDVELEPGDYYVTSGLSGNHSELSEPGRMFLQVVVFKPSGTKYYMNTGFTIDGTEARIVCDIIYNSATLQAINLFNFKPMLNRGSTALPWEPYHTPQKLTLSTSNGLPGIPVDSGGNYTDESDQQWICDEVDLKRGKYVQRVKKVVYDGSEDERWNIEEAKIGNRFSLLLDELYMNSDTDVNGSHSMNSNFALSISGGTYSRQNCYAVKIGRIYVSLNGPERLEQLRQYLKQNPMTVLYAFETPIETDLSEEELTAYAALRTNYPTTVVTSDSDPEVGIEVEYVADTKTYIDNKFAELAQSLAATQNTLLEV